MLGGWPPGGVWLSTAPADMCCSFDGLCALVSTHLGENPASGRWYIFVDVAAPSMNCCGPAYVAERVDWPCVHEIRPAVRNIIY